ncbi:hypothetical protein SteCoe_28267 [Stentor coeruleus]|uniref:Uncharacterized protein n=1 Tax=Stentor coeruleus TaxID=5963 RepID=A0A1R2B8K9_9CILI|nr:hypothetical protein SteCoe_28267 [Stentor coeruleus]
MIESQERKIKTFRVRLPLKTNETVSKIPHKHIIKVTTKVIKAESIDKSLAKDYILENGDPKDFLKEEKDDFEEFGYKKLQEISRKSSVGIFRPIELLQEKYKSDKHSSSTVRRELHRKKYTVKHIFASFLEKEIHLKDREAWKKSLIERQIEIINQRIDQTKHTQNTKFCSLQSRDKIAFTKQERSLSRFDHIVKKWEKIEKGLLKKLKKPNKPLLPYRKKSVDNSDNDLSINWYMTLRQNSELEKIERFLPVGNKLSGIYSRNIITTEKGPINKSMSCPELKVIGCSKLPLEIDAMISNRLTPIKTHYEENKIQDEIFVENYDFNNKFLKEF